MKNKITNHFSGNFQNFYSKYLPNAKKLKNNEFTACCPFHDDKTPSFGFNAATGVFYCHGCQCKGDIFSFYQKINKKEKFTDALKGICSDFNIGWDNNNNNRSRALKEFITNFYDYQDEDSNYLYSVVRFQEGDKEKTFRQWQSQNGNGWIYNIHNIRTVLYRLPQVIDSKEVIICKGEKDCDNLTCLGFCATTNPAGAGKWLPEYSDSLKGKDIIIMPDNDEAGKNHLSSVVGSLKDSVNSIKIINLPGLDTKEDVSDFIDKFDDKEEATERLCNIIDGAEISKDVSFNDGLIKIKDLHTLDLKPRETYLNPWLKESSITLVSGWRGVGKTWFALGILEAVSSGKNFGPWQGLKPIPCLYLDGEMCLEDIQDRVKGSEAYYIYSDDYTNRLGLPKSHLNDEAWRANMHKLLITNDIKLWVIDNISSLSGGIDENSKQDWDIINQWLIKLRFDGISTILIHHLGKGGQQRGTSAREDNIDNSILLQPSTGYAQEEGAKFICNFSKTRIGTKDIELISDTEFFLKDGEWLWKNVKSQKKINILKMINEEVSIKDICDDLEVTRQYVSKIKKNAIRNGWMAPDGHLTQSGYLANFID